MYKVSFGKVGQIRFNNQNEYYELLGFLAKSNGGTKLKWEDNDVKGTAWGKELRIEFFILPPGNLSAYLKQTLGNGFGILSRVNCNEFVRNIVNNHNFIMGGIQNIGNIRGTIPAQFHPDFDRGLTL
jgi:hypothetical protein